MADNISDYLLAGLESDSKVVFDNILTALKDAKINKDIIEGLTMIIESFLENPEAGANKTAFIVELPKYMTSDLEILRTALPTAIKKFLPSTLNKTTAIKVLGVKNKTVPLPVVYARYSTLMKLQKGQIFQSSLSKSWGLTGEIDSMIGTIGVFSFNNTFIQDVELDSFLEKSFLFKHTKELEKLISSKKAPLKNDFVELIKSYAISQVDELQLKSIALETFVPGVLSLNEFNVWWNEPSSKKIQTPDTIEQIDIQSARSIHELHTILKNNEAKLKKITDDKVINHICSVLNQIKASSKLKDFMNWAESISMLNPLVSVESIKTFAPKDNGVQETVWPLYEMNDICLGIWTQLKALDLSNWIIFTEHIEGLDYLKKVLALLPWKVWPSLCGKLSTAFIESTIEESNKVTNAEMLLWMWKNKDKLGSETLSKLSYSAVIPAIYRSKPGALWQTGPKELKRLLLENADFQSQITGKETEENIIGFLEYLNNSSILTSVDRQTIIVKLSRLSPKAKEILNSDRAKKLIASKQQRSPQEAKEEVYITSNKSFNDKIKELKDLINRQIPENTEALTSARAHGDLRENAEFAAAKERQKFLNEHRIILEVRISSTQPTDFSDAKVSDTVIIGSTITLSYENNTKETFHILGAWDSNPAKKYVSYDTDLGKAVTGKKLKDSVMLPDGKKCIISHIEKISQKIIDELK
ncbi:MAG: GreA/GreB family elongation factor [Lentisphaerota bacterium]